MSTTEPTDSDREWLMREYDAAPALPITKSAPAGHRSPKYLDRAFAESVREQLAKERRERIELAHEVGSLRQELATLKAELDTAKRLDELRSRLDRVEASRSHLRSVG